MKSKKKKIGDSGIRLKPNEPNILENYTKYRKKRKTKKRKPKRKSKKIKNVEIKEKTDPLLQIVEQSQNKPKEELVVEEIKPIQQIKTIHVDNKPQDLSEKDPNVKKTVTITSSLKPDKDKDELIL
tara:strand:- start:462 stop:839 length:378 start_codon:yes stop_codon:yes gene_type:complete